MWSSSRSNPAASARSAAATNASRRASMSSRVMAAGAGQLSMKGIAEGPIVGQAWAAGRGASPSQGSDTEALRPACASCRPIFVAEWACTKSTMRRHASRCSSFHMPAQPGVIRPSGVTAVASAITRPAPPTARLPRCTRCQSFTVPSTAEYWHMGETTTRFGSTQSRIRKGANIGSGIDPSSVRGRPARGRTHSVTSSTSSGSRDRRFSYVMRLERVIRLKVKGTGSWTR